MKNRLVFLSTEY